MCIRDRCYVRLRYTDENGLLKPLARGDIRVAVEGLSLIHILSVTCSMHRLYTLLQSSRDRDSGVTEF